MRQSRYQQQETTTIIPYAGETKEGRSGISKAHSLGLMMHAGTTVLGGSGDAEEVQLLLELFPEAED